MINSLKILTLLALIILLATACLNSKSKTVPTISSFTATFDAINEGEQSLLEWEVSGEDTLAIDQGVGDVTGKTSKFVKPTTTTTYTLTATNDQGDVTEDVKVTVNPAAEKLTINSFTATPSTIDQGNTSKLAWDVTGTAPITLEINKGVGLVTGTERDVKPTITTTYTLTAKNDQDSVTKDVTVTVNPAAEKPTINSFTATPSTIDQGSTSTLAWDVTGNSPITLEINKGVGPVTGTERNVKPSTTTTYTLTAKNDQGSVTKDVTVTVNPAAEKPTINSFTATFDTINEGEKSLLEWEVSGATTLSIDQGVGDVTGKTSKFVSPTKTTKYTLTATNDQGSVTKDVTVTVNSTAATAPKINSFTADPDTIVAGKTTILSWDVTGTEPIELKINLGVGIVTGTNRRVQPPTTRTYTLTATNSEGSVTADVTVTVE